MVSKDLHALLVNPAHQSTWIAARKNAKLAKPPVCSVMSEYHYASLLYASHCFGCGNEESLPDVYYRKRWCKDCRKLNLIPFDPTRYHPDTANCIRTSRYTKTLSNNGYGREFTSHAEAQQCSHKLYELRRQDVDFEKRSLIPRKFDTQNEHENSTNRQSLVSKYVREREDVLTQSQEVVRGLQRRMYELKMEAKHDERELKEFYSVGNQRRLAIEYKLLKLNDGWMEKDFRGRQWKYSASVSKNEVLQDDEWSQLLPRLLRLRAKIRDKQNSDRIASDRARRKDRVKKLYEIMLEADSHQVFPPWNNFAYLESVLPFWYPEESPKYEQVSDNEAEDVDEIEEAIDDSDSDVKSVTNVSKPKAKVTRSITFIQERWDEALEEIKKDALEFSEVDRARAVHAIMVASSTEELDDDLSLYSEANYPDSVFDRPDSFFFCPSTICYHYGQHRPSTSYHFFGTYPDLLQHLSSKPHHFAYSDLDEVPSPSSGFSYIASSCIRTILKMAGIDHETATIGDLASDDFGHFSWPDGPKPDKEYHWFDLICAVRLLSQSSEGLPDVITFTNDHFETQIAEELSDEELLEDGTMSD